MAPVVSAVGGPFWVDILCAIESLLQPLHPVLVSLVGAPAVVLIQFLANRHPGKLWCWCKGLGPCHLRHLAAVAAIWGLTSK